MRYYEINEDIGRRGFLQGLGAAAGLGAVGYGAVQQKNKAWDTPGEPTRDGIRSVDVPTQPDRKSAPNAAKPVIQKYSPEYLERYLINYASKHLSSLRELIEFMAQVKTETHNFRSLIEYGGGKDRYHGGKEFLGRGFIQLTHKHNYEKYGEMIGQDLVTNPDLLLRPDIAAAASVAYWKDYVWPTSRRLMIKFKNQFKTLTAAVTKSVNGGSSKLKERQQNVIYYTEYFKKNPPVMPNAQKSKTGKSK